MKLGQQPTRILSSAGRGVAEIAANRMSQLGPLTHTQINAIWHDAAELLANKAATPEDVCKAASAIYKLGIVSVNGDVVNIALARNVSTRKWRETARASLLRLAKCILADSPIDDEVALLIDPSGPSLRLGANLRPLSWASDPQPPKDTASDQSEAAVAKNN